MPTPYSPSGVYPTFPLSLVNDGESYQFTSIMDALVKKLIDGVDFAKQRTIAGSKFVSGKVRSTAVAPTILSGSGFTLGAYVGNNIKVTFDVARPNADYLVLVQTIFASLLVTSTEVVIVGAPATTDFSIMLFNEADTPIPLSGAVRDFTFMVQDL